RAPNPDMRMVKSFERGRGATVVCVDMAVHLPEGFRYANEAFLLRNTSFCTDWSNVSISPTVTGGMRRPRPSHTCDRRRRKSRIHRPEQPHEGQPTPPIRVVRSSPRLGRPLASVRGGTWDGRRDA